MRGKGLDHQNWMVVDGGEGPGISNILADINESPQYSCLNSSSKEPCRLDHIYSS